MAARGGHRARKSPPASGLAALDHRLSAALYRAGRRLPRLAYKALEHGGDGRLWLPLAAAAAAAPGLAPAARALWLTLLLGLLLDLALVGLAKALARRSRPAYNHAADFRVVVAVDAYSFPSGHSSRAAYVAAFAACTALAARPSVAAAAAAWAGCTALSRAAMGRHYLGDVLAGAAVGLVTAAAVTQGTFSEAGLLVDAAAAEHLRQVAAAQLRGLAAAWQERLRL